MSIVLTPDKITRLDTSHRDTDFIGYYTLKLYPTATCAGCGKVMQYVECDLLHLVVVWEEMDDFNLLHCAAELQRVFDDVRIVSYEQTMGKCVDFYSAKGRGLIGT